MIIPQIWSNPQNIFAYTLAARENILNIVPPSSMRQGYTTFPSRLGNTHYISDLDVLREIFVTRPRDFPKSRSISVLLRPAIPHSIFVAEADDWQNLHRQMVEIFNMRNIRSRAAAIAQTASDYLDRHPFENVSGDITPYMQDITFTVISQIILGVDDHPLFDELRELVDDYILRGTRANLVDILSIRFENAPNTRYLTMRRTISRIFAICDALIDERVAAAPSETGDFLEHLLTAYQYRAEPDAQKKRIIRDNLTTFLVAGHETTAISLAWAIYVLGYFPEHQRALAAEHDAPLFDRPLTDSFVKEVMRLYPAAAMTARITAQDEQWGDLRIKRGEGIIIPFISIQRHVEYWDDPERFDPNRFANFKPRPMSYLPFGAGPRVCIGQSLALLEMRVILPATLSRVQIAPNGHEPIPHVSLTMRSKNGIEADIHPLD